MTESKGYEYAGPSDWFIYAGKAYQPKDVIPIPLAEAEQLRGHQFVGVNGWGIPVTEEPQVLPTGPGNLAGFAVPVVDNVIHPDHVEGMGIVTAEDMREAQQAAADQAEVANAVATERAEGELTEGKAEEKSSTPRRSPGNVTTTVTTAGVPPVTPAGITPAGITPA